MAAKEYFEELMGKKISEALMVRKDSNEPLRPKLHLRIETMGGKEKRIVVKEIRHECLICDNKNSRRTDVVIPITAIAEFYEIDESEGAR